MLDCIMSGFSSTKFRTNQIIKVEFMAAHSFVSISKLWLNVRLCSRNSKEFCKFVWKTFVPNFVQIGLKIEAVRQIFMYALKQAVMLAAPTTTTATAA